MTDLTNYAKWMCYALDRFGRKVITQQFYEDHGEPEGKRLDAEFKKQFSRWNKLTKPEQEAFKTQRSIELLAELHRVAA